MGLATVIGQVIFTIIFLVVFVQIYTMNHQQTSMQAQTLAEEREYLKQKADTSFAIESIAHSSSKNITSVRLINNGEVMIDTTTAEVYIDAQKILRTRTLKKFIPCAQSTIYRCGEIGFNDTDFEIINLTGLWHHNNDSDTADNASQSIDYSVYKNTGTPINTTIVAGKFVYAHSFNGVSSYIQISQQPHLSFDHTGPLTISLWIYPRQFSSVRTIISKNAGTGGSGKGYKLFTDASGNLIFQNRKNAVDFNSTYALSLNSWQHITVTYASGGTVVLYVNGQLKHNSTDDTFATDGTTNINIGRNIADTNEYFSGYIDEVAIYNTTLSTANITYLYKKGFESKNPLLWDAKEAMEIDFYTPLQTGSHRLTISTANGVKATGEFTI